jgi:UDP-2-acetamido-2,6-beta-L-arabino-hexul-4-ose reductase
VQILVTGAQGFIGKNLLAHLGRRADTKVLPVTRQTSLAELRAAASAADFVFHLAGINRPKSENDFATGNVEFTRALCGALRDAGSHAPIVYASSIQATQDNPYGRSKRGAEEVLLERRDATAAPVTIYRLANVFGKWCRPNYNSAVATFCHNIARDLPIEIHDPARVLQLLYVDDVIEHFLRTLERPDGQPYAEAGPVYSITVGELASCLRAFRASRSTLVTEAVGHGLMRALYATYVSCLPPERFSYPIPKYGDARGVFAEMLKTKDSGQFSFFTAHPGITRGIHYHHSKTEKFLVIKGRARFRFRDIITDQRVEVFTSGDVPEVVETVPGWSHDITNVGDDEMVVMLWANEIFDRDRPDTYSHPVWQ